MDKLIARDEAFDQFQRASRRLERMLSSLTGRQIGPDRQIPHLDWTVGDLALHVTQGVEVAGELVQGKPSPYGDMHQIAETNAEFLQRDPERNIDRLVLRFVKAVRFMEQRFREMPDDFIVPFHAGAEFKPPQAMVMMSSELLIHGWDLAQVTGEKFEIEPQDACRIMYTITPIMPEMVIQEAARGFVATYEICLRGGECLRLHFDEGDLSVSHVAPGGPADCRVDADAPAFLMMGYGRGSQLKLILTGKIRASGPKPWLAGKFGQLVKKP
ncbi:MAG: maleylpyruvate isomerase family mycothiol-dependent enzyme [Sphaerobacteraceae bacterium]|nr:MAG: maleylpyruvate isomerase family mycothiol-dependent enzyme [Sphaerobacteraceae bacterium]